MKVFQPFVQPESASYRYEKKFFVTGLCAADVITILKHHPAMFRELYPMRYVNNIYLDSPLLSDYYSNVNGYRQRQKVRLRWYHDLFRKVDDGILEFKKKEGEVGTKEQHPFPSFIFDTNLTEPAFRDLFKTPGLPEKVKYQLQDVEFAICNRYRRWYYATPDKRYRATIDAGLTFHHLGKLTNRFLHTHRDPYHLVVELKYMVKDDPDAHRIINALPFRITRSSKYVSGIEHIYI